MFSLEYLAKTVQGKLVLKEKNNSISSIASIENAKEDQLAYLTHKKFLSQLQSSKAGLIILKEEFLNDCPNNALLVDNPVLAFTKLSHLFKNKSTTPNSIHPTAIIDASAVIAKDVNIGAYCVIGKNVNIQQKTTIQSNCIIEDNVTLGENCYLHPNITLAIDVILGNNCELHSGCVIGSDGFANALDSEKKWHKIAQLGSVIIGNNVEIGANTTIDRGAIENTIIANGVRIDNLVHIAHNVQLGEDCAIAACVAIAGSTTLGKRVLIGGNAAIADHVSITDDVIITGLTAIYTNIDESDIYTGFLPFLPHKKWMKNAVWLKKFDKIISFLNIKRKDLI